MTYAHIVNGAVASYPLSRRQVRQAFYPNTVGDAVFDSVAADAGYVLVTVPPVPTIIDAQNLEPAPAPVLEDGVWTRGWVITDASAEEITERFAIAKENKRAAVGAMRESRFQNGYTVPSGPMAGSVLQVGTIEDRTNWLTSQAAYAAAVAQGAGAVTEANFRTADNQTHTITYLEGLTALLAMAAWGASVMERSWALKDAVAAATDHTALEAIDIEENWP